MLKRVSSQFVRRGSKKYLRDAALLELRQCAADRTDPLGLREPEVEDRVAQVQPSISLFHNFAEEKQEDVPGPHHLDDEARVDKELEEYYALPALERNFHPDMDQLPLLWWKRHQKKLPILARLARKYLAVHADSAAVERMFSYTGNRVGKKDSALGDESLLSLMLVRSLSRFVDKYRPKYLPRVIVE